MKSIAILFALTVCLRAQEGPRVNDGSTPVQQDLVLIRKVARGTNGLLPLTRSEWKAVTTARKAQPGSVLHSYAEATTNPPVNASYFATMMVMVESELMEPFMQVHKRPPFSQEVFAAWLVGPFEFKRLKYDFSKIRDPVAWRKIDALVYEKRLFNLSISRDRSPPPLPVATLVPSIHTQTNIGPGGVVP